MSDLARGNWLDRPVNEKFDHVLGPTDAAITLVEYGSYACPYCRAANERIAEVRDQFGDRLRYVFRHRPLVGVELARRAAELVERAEDPKRFWDAHIKLMTRSETLTEDDLQAVANDLGVPADAGPPDDPATLRAKARVDADERSSQASGALITPTFFINGRRYDGPWDESALADAMLGRLGHRVRSAALDFASWGPSAGVLLLLATLVAVVLTNTGLGSGFAAFWEQKLGFTLDGLELCAVFGALDQRRTAHRLLSGRGPRDQARIHGRPPRRVALGRAAGRRRNRRHDRAGGALSSGRSARTLVAWLGRADVDRHRLRGGADRHVGIARPGRTAHLPHRGGDRRRSLRNRCGRRILFGRAEPRLSGGGRSADRRVGVAQPVARLRADALHRRRLGLVGVRARRAACTRLWPA